MLGLDDKIAALGTGEAFLIVAVIAFLLGLRHATDPDHLVAVSTLVASSEENGTRRAARLGGAWGLGHATTLTLFGLPIVLFNEYLPERVQQAAEVAIGLVIMALALRLLVRWRRGQFHGHRHRHGRVEHRHLHAHQAIPSHAHDHLHDPELGRTPLQAYSIGLVHGMGGSAGVGVLLLAAIPSHVEGALALVVFALATAVSMAIASTSFGYALSRSSLRRRFGTLAPALGTLSLAFGAWYALGALQALPYFF
jgi:ABC-type nickel/cobalt efflux system permease component RcnA